MSTSYTVRMTAGNARDNAMTATLCPTLADALRVAATELERVGPRYAPLYSVEIVIGDHAPRIVSGEWVWPGYDGWAA